MPRITSTASGCKANIVVSIACDPKKLLDRKRAEGLRLHLIQEEKVDTTSKLVASRIPTYMWVFGRRQASGSLSVSVSKLDNG